jgi:hypothetical protein
MKQYLALLLALTFASACSTHRGIKPLEPQVGHYSPTVVGSLAPTFRWEAFPEPDTRYDFAIFEVLESVSLDKPFTIAKG